MKSIWLLWLALTGMILAGCDSEPQPPPPPAGPLPARTGLPFDGGADFLLIDDLDGDGRLDIALTSHAENYSQVFRQTSPRRFQAGPKITQVGFHPNGWLPLPYPERRLYLMNAEGNHSLRVFEAAAGGALRPVAGRSISSPLHSAVLPWPDWGLALAVIRFDGRSLTLLKDFDPLTGEAGQEFVLTLEGISLRPSTLTVTDLDGDGVPELLFATRLKDLWQVRYPGGGEPRLERLLRLEGSGTHIPQVVPADLNGDGHEDLLLPLQAQAQIAVLDNDGAGRLRERTWLWRTDRMALLQDDRRDVVQTIATAVDRNGERYLFAALQKSLVLYRLGPDGEALDSPLHLPLPRSERIPAAAIQDVDGDGWVDLVIGRVARENAGVVIYGPLWQHVTTLAAEGFQFEEATSHADDKSTDSPR